MAIIYTGDTPSFNLSITEGGQAVDLSGASSVDLAFQKPSGTLLTKSGSVTGAANDVISASLTGAEVDESGLWYVQGKITGLAGWTGSAARKGFVVSPGL